METAMVHIPDQTLIIWVLLGLLMAWMVTFAVLAFRSEPKKSAMLDDLPTPANSFPIVHAPMTLHVVAPPQLPAPLASGSHDTGEMGRVPIA